MAAIAISTNTVATLINDEITKIAIPTQELSCCGFIASIVTFPSESFKVSKLQFDKSSHEFILRHYYRLNMNLAVQLRS